MKVWQCDDTRPVPALREGDLLGPRPRRDQLLIEVHAAGVTPTELLWFPTTHTQSGDERADAIPCHEFSGVVIQCPDSVQLAGQTVFGMNGWFEDGACAEYCCALSTSVARKPERLSHVEAASIPIAALTAWQGLFDRADLRAGQRVLIHGGSGSVGVFAIQLARWRGAEVITTASQRNQEFLLKLGAQQVIDYHTECFEEIVREIDVVFDTVGGATLERSWQVLAPRGRVIAIAAASEGATDERVKDAFFIVEPSQKQLGEVARLIDLGHLRPIVDAVVPFAQTPTAFSGSVSPRLGYGKTVISVRP